MQNELKKPMNGSINVLKFIMALFIFLVHAGAFNNDTYFQGGYIYIEWFYIFMGWTLAKAIVNLPKDEDVALGSFKIIYKRIAKIMPYFILSSLIALAVKLHFNQMTISSPWDINLIVHEILMLQMTTIQVVTLTGTGWFLSSMLIALIIIVPIFIKLRKEFYPIAFVVATLIYYYIYKEIGYLYHPVEWLITYKGNLRAIAGMSLGICGYAISPVIKNVFKNKIIASIFVILAYLGIFYYVYKVDESVYYFIIPYIFMILISITMNVDDIFGDNVFTRFLGDISMVLFMNHYYIIHAIKKAMPLLDNRTGFIYATLLSFGTSILVLLTVKLLSKMHSKIIKKL